MVYVILADGCIDQLTDSKRGMKRDTKWLKDRGFRVVVKSFQSWFEAEGYADKHNEKG